MKSTDAELKRWIHQLLPETCTEFPPQQMQRDLDSAHSLGPALAVPGARPPSS